MNKSDLPAILFPELEFQTTRSQGPGGQHVNKVETKVILRWNYKQSSALNDKQRLLLEKSKEFRNRINKEGEIILSHDQHRSQVRNKDAVIDRFYKLLLSALSENAERKRTAPSRAVKERRLRDKRSQSEKKATRRLPDDERD